MRAMPGDLLVHSARLIHRADPNSSSSRHRRSIGEIFKSTSASLRLRLYSHLTAGCRLPLRCHFLWRVRGFRQPLVRGETGTWAPPRHPSSPSTTYAASGTFSALLRRRRRPKSNGELRCSRVNILLIIRCEDDGCYHISRRCLYCGGFVAEPPTPQRLPRGAKFQPGPRSAIARATCFSLTASPPPTLQCPGGTPPPATPLPACTDPLRNVYVQ